MQGFTTLDLATVLGEAHREELTTALRTRPGPSQRWTGLAAVPSLV